MLKKFGDIDKGNSPFVPGTSVYVVMRDGSILEGYQIVSRLGELVALDRSPLDGSEKQGFTIKDDYLVPNWCEGKRNIVAVCVMRIQAEELAKGIRESLSARGGSLRQPKTPRKSCDH